MKYRHGKKGYLWRGKVCQLRLLYVGIEEQQIMRLGRIFITGTKQVVMNII